MNEAKIIQLRQEVRGSVVTTDDEGYDVARRVYNAMIDRRPAVIVTPANAGDVMTAVRFAPDNDLPVAVRGGSHSVPGFGTCDGGLVVDLSSQRSVRSSRSVVRREPKGSDRGRPQRRGLPVRARDHRWHHLDNQVTCRVLRVQLRVQTQPRGSLLPHLCGRPVSRFGEVAQPPVDQGHRRVTGCARTTGDSGAGDRAGLLGHREARPRQVDLRTLDRDMVWPAAVTCRDGHDDQQFWNVGQVPLAGDDDGGP